MFRERRQIQAKFDTAGQGRSNRTINEQNTGSDMRVQSHRSGKASRESFSNTNSGIGTDYTGSAGQQRVQQNSTGSVQQNSSGRMQHNSTGGMQQHSTGECRAIPGGAGSDNLSPSCLKTYVFCSTTTNAGGNFSLQQTGTSREHVCTIRN